MAESYNATAFVVHGNWGPETRKHPALKLIELGAREYFDTGDHSNKSDFWQDSISLSSPHGGHLPKDDSSHESQAELVDTFFMKPLSKFHHEANVSVALEKEDGWDVHTTCWLFADVAGDAHASEEKHPVKDMEGREWDLRIPVYYHFDVVKDPSAKYGMKMAHWTAIKDTGVINAKLDKRGHGHRKSHKH